MSTFFRRVVDCLPNYTASHHGASYSMCLLYCF